MELAALAHGEAWMTEEELRLNRQFVEGVGALLESRGVVENPLLSLRVNDIVVSWLLVRRMEVTLADAQEEDAGAPRLTSSQADAIGKSRERLRKSIKDFEDYCARAGTPIDTGLADAMKPVIQQVQGGRPFYEAAGATPS